MAIPWLTLTRKDVETERRQCVEEGRTLASVEAEFEWLLSGQTEDEAFRRRAGALLDRTAELPVTGDLAGREPSDLAGIRRLTAKAPSLPDAPRTDEALLDRLHGAWLGRCAGCLLGKPIEGWRTPQFEGFLKDSDQWPLTFYIRSDVGPAIVAKHKVDASRPFINNVTHMVEDDDTNYTVAALAIYQTHGQDFTPEQVGAFWARNIPLLRTCTAERVAYRNLANGRVPPATATFRNPYREWIGAQIRADFWGYVATGDPVLAAELAWRDASISHVKNGIYGAMWVSAMLAAAACTDDLPTIVEAGLAQIPCACRLHEAVTDVLDWHRHGVSLDQARERIHTRWDENHAHDWCHTISNAQVVAAGLLWGEGDFGRSVCGAVSLLLDTDCNGATVGSIVGMMRGASGLPDAWTQPLGDTLETGVVGHARSRIWDLAGETLRLARSRA